MRTRVVAFAAVVVVALAAVIGWKSCGSASDRKRSSAATSSSSTAAGSGSARARGPRGPVKPASMAGRVIDQATGRGISGAVVSLARAELLQRIIPSGGEVTAVVVTNTDGVWTAPSVVPGTYFVAATADGYLPASRERFSVESGESKTGVDITLAAGGSILSGTISDIGGGPIADARIRVQSDDAELDLRGAPEYTAISKADGTYQLSLPDGDYEVRASHDDYTRARRNVEIAGEPMKLDFTLTPGAVVRGQVVASDSGKPVPGALLVAESSGRGNNEGTTRTDDDGAFVVRGLAPGAVSLRAQGPGYASASPTIVAVGVGEQIDGVKVLVDRAFSIAGRVVRKGKPEQGVPGIQVGVFSIGTQQYGLALEPTDDKGEFVIHGVRPASYMLFAGGEANVPEVGVNVDVVDKDVSDVVIEMATGVTLTGRIEPPQAKVEITVEIAGGVGLLNWSEAVKGMLVRGQTDEAGAFTVQNVPSGAFTLVARASGGDTGTLGLMIGQTDQTGLVIPMETRASISGRLVDDKGTAIADARITAENTKPDEDGFSINFREREGATTRRDGSFKVVGLEPGTYQLRARDNERNGALKLVNKEAGKVTVAQGQQATGIVLTVEARDGVIRGVVIGADKKPVADAWVTAERERPDWKKLQGDMQAGAKKPTEEEVESWQDVDWGPTRPVLTGADGRFVIDRLRRGVYKVVVDGPRGTSRGELADVKTGASVTITLLSLGTLSGKVTVGGAPVTPYDIACDGPDDDTSSRTIDAADGTYRLERLPPGAYECTVTAAAGTAKAKVDVPPGDATLDVALERWGVITGKLVDVLTKKPVAGVVVATSGGTFDAKWIENMMRGTAPKSDVNGTFVLDRVPAGSGQVVMLPRDMTMFGKPLASKNYTVKSGERVDLGTVEIVAPREGDAGTFGFGTNVVDGKLVVSSVKADGPAAGAGIREGDVITALNGMPVAQLGVEIAQNLVSSGTVGVGVPVRLAIDRGGTPVDVSLVSVKW